ncbi:MAG: hypothetical protein GF411_05645 [Candidatus Lokiarchaeota archaeon]|nr:hypothetical protein [Candidatus Lokiarchaeota archaeon]
MYSYLFLYDCKRARQTNARRVAFTKEIYGYSYSWKTKSGLKQKRKQGLLDQYEGVEAVSDSAILVPEDYYGIFEKLFQEYNDIMNLRIFRVTEEV